MVKKALEKEPDTGAYLDSLGWVYYKKRTYKKAEQYLKKAVKFSGRPGYLRTFGRFICCA